MAKVPRVPRLTFVDISRAAEEFLAAHHPAGELPIPIEELIEFDCGLDIVPIPGTRHVKYLEENAAAVKIQLSQSELRRIDEVAPRGAAVGDRYPDMSTVNK